MTTPLIACLDAAYADHVSAAACVFARGEAASPPYETIVHRAGRAAAYEPGAFYKRELPLLRAVLAAAPHAPDILIIDGFVHLDADGAPGLGAHLHDATGLPVIGVAKTAYRDCAAWSAHVQRGRAIRPLFVTAIGMTRDAAAELVAHLDGPHRIPALLAAADRAARDALNPR